MITLDDVATTATPGRRARAAGELIEQCHRDVSAARQIVRQAIKELLLHGATDHEIARTCGVPVWMVDHVRTGVGS